MKKILSGLSAIAIVFSAMAQNNPAVVPDLQIMAFTPDNKACVGEIMNSIFLFDMNNLSSPKIFSESDDGLIGYAVGHGNFLSNCSAMVFRNEDGASAWCWSAEGSILNGRWRNMNSGDITSMGTPNAVTADGSRACGNMAGEGQFGQENVTYVTPCIWDYNGTTFTRAALDCPTTDYAGLAPQYITALAISDDGKTIIGQLVSNNGFLCEYIVYKQDADGKWSYVKPFADKVNPNHLVLPEYPGESPEAPMAEAYLTPSEKEAFDKAMAEYEAGQGEEPDAEDYLKDPAAQAAYLAALEAYNAWGKKYQEYIDVDELIRLQSISFCFNSGAISPNGKYFCASAVKSYFNQDGTTDDVYEPVLYDLEEMKQIEIPIEAPDQPGFALSLNVTGVSDNGDIIGYERMSDIDFGYVLKSGAKAWTPLEDYIIERQPSMASWIEKNWFHTIEVLTDVDGEDESYEYQDMFITGLPIISRDFSMISTCVYVFWNDGDASLLNHYVSYIIDLNKEATSIIELSADNSAENAAFYNLQGVKIANPDHRGIYIQDGKKILIK